MNVLHVIHDFLPRHAAGSEIYASDLASALARRRHHVTVLCADYDLTRPHGQVNWRVHDGLPVAEIVNNWKGRSFEDTYRPVLIGERIEQLLDAIQPDVVHVHNLLNLSLELPRLARARGIPVVATLHDYTLVCPSGGQRVHRAQAHVCVEIDTTRCARCFRESPFYTQMAVGAITSIVPAGWLQHLAVVARRYAPAAAKRAAGVARDAAVTPVSPALVDARLTRTRQVFHEVALFVAPSTSIGEEFIRLGVDRDRMLVSRHGQVGRSAVPVARPRAPLQVGFVGTIVWHKGVHVLLEAVRSLSPTQFQVHVFGSLTTDPNYVAGLRSQADGFPVRFDGPFDRADAPEVFAQIDVLVVPSLWPENAPLVIQEALQAGVSVVAARIGGIPEFLEDGVTGRLFSPGATDELTAILADLIRHPEQVRAMTAPQPVQKSMDEDAREWEDRYRHAVQSAGRAS